mgnify:CR=1 FL=1
MYLYHKNHQTCSYWSTGGAYIYPLHQVGPYKLIIGIECEFSALKRKQIARFDTGAELSIVSDEIYQMFAEEHAKLDSPVGKTRIHTRLGTFEGNLYRVVVSLSAEWGEPLTIEGTFLFCQEWTGPTVLGFHGFLERIRFAIDPNYEQTGCIYFAAAD